MRMWLRATLLVMVGCLLLAGCSGTGGDGGGGGGGGGGDNGGGGGGGGGDVDTDGIDTDTSGELPALIKTRISFSCPGALGDIPDAGGKLAVGDDLIVYGIDELGIFFLVPSAVEIDDLPTEGTLIPNSDQLFDHRSFEVAGKKVALVRSSYLVSVFDTTTGALEDIPGGQVTLDRFVLPVEANRPGQMIAAGSYIATINDTTAVNDGTAIKVIDVSGAEPVVLSFPTPEEFEGGFNQVAVDADSRRVAAHGTNPGDVLYVWDLDDPQAAPLAFDMGERGGLSDNAQMIFDGGRLIYQDDTFDGDWEIALLDVAADSVTVLDNNPAPNSAPVALSGGSLAYFVTREEADTIFGSTAVYRSAIGRVADAPDAVLANQFDTFSLRESDIDTDGIVDRADCVDEPGRVGYGSTACILPDGSRWFIAGAGPVDYRLAYLQMSAGGAFVDFDDPDDASLTGCVMASDVVCSQNVVAFRAVVQVDSGLGCATEDDWVLGFIIPQRLD